MMPRTGVSGGSRLPDPDEHDEPVIANIDRIHARIANLVGAGLQYLVLAP